MLPGAEGVTLFYPAQPFASLRCRALSRDISQGDIAAR